MSLERTPDFDQALELMQSGGPFTFITGRAGTGKSTLLSYFRLHTALNTPVLAPTGIAALHVNGETIHRFFGFSPGITVRDAKKLGSQTEDAKLYRNTDAIIIDEISMVRADLLDCMDQFLQAVRKNKSPFGGVRVIAIGDLHQLPPVVTTAEREAFSELYASPYFFSALVMKKLYQNGAISYLELEKVYRQSDQNFIAILNAVRDRSIQAEQLQQLNKQVHKTPSEDAIILTSINAAADACNQKRLQEISGESKTFYGRTGGDFPEREAPTDLQLELKQGARVMCIANDPQGKYVNGSLGWVTGFDENENDSKDRLVKVRLDTGATISLLPYSWNVYRSTYNQETKSLDQEKLGSFTQYPLKLAWAVTIHKSQGKTFDEVTIDLGNGAFASGQTYVALSRCRSLEGISLIKPIKFQDIRLNSAISKFLHLLKEPSGSNTELEAEIWKTKKPKPEQTYLLDAF